MKQFEIVSLGESLLDFVSVKGAKGKITMEGDAGGATTNVLAMAAKLGRKTSYITKVGRDNFGTFFKEKLVAAGVDISSVVTAEELTTLAMVTLDKAGDRSFVFYRNGTADVMLRDDEVDMELVENCGIFHFGAVTLTTEPVRTATLEAAARAKAAGVKVSFDPNYRSHLWQDTAYAIASMREGVELADYVKLSDEEATMLTGEQDPEKAALALISKYGFQFGAVTLGPKGCVGVSAAARVKLPTYDVPCVDTTGAGDAFWGAVLHKLLAVEEWPMDEEKIREVLQFGNAAGSLATTKYGAVTAQATEAEILACIKNEKLL